MAISNYGIGGFDNADSSFQGLGNLVSTFVLNVILGCTDTTQFNYNPNATVDDGSCIPITGGCTDPAAVNYNVNVNTDDGSCIYTGCTDSTAVNYNPLATVDDGSCTMATYGCTVTTTALIGDGSGFDYPIYWNSSSSYNSPCDDTNGPGCFGMQTGPNCCCEPVIVGCTDPLATNYDQLANYQAQPGSSMECIVTILGCTNPTANNYNSSANVDDGSCTYTVIFGCTDPTAYNYNASATQDDGTCQYLGCTDPTACNFDSMANVDDGTCYYPDGCTDPAYVEYDASYLCDDGSCSTLVVLGCTDPLATNHDANANTDDGSCIYCVYGCTDPLYTEYVASATCDDGSCATLYGCTDSTACNYNSNATVDDGSCTYKDPKPTCTDSNGITYTIGEMHPTLQARLAMFSYDEPDSGMAAGDCGRMYASTYTVEQAVSQSTGCSVTSQPGNFFPMMWGNDNEIVPASNPSGNLYSTQSQKPGWGYQNTEDWEATGSVTGGYNVGVTCTGGGTAFYSDTHAQWVKRSEFESAVGVADWHIPSVDELLAVWNNLGPGSNYKCPSYASSNYTTNSCMGPSVQGSGWSEFSTGCTPSAEVVQGVTSNEDANDADDKYITIKWHDGTIGQRLKTIYQMDTAARAVVYEGNFGCTDPTDINNYDPTASWDDGSCVAPLAIGDAYQGGYIFHFNNGVDITDGALIASYDQITTINNVHWGCEGELVSGASGFAVGTGYQNTQDILAHQSVNGVSCAPFSISMPSAAQACDNYSITENGVTYDDWYLPSKDELDLFLANLPIGQGYLITTDRYWSSTQHDEDKAWISLHNGTTYTSNKSTYSSGTFWPHAVRAIRNTLI